MIGGSYFDRKTVVEIKQQADDSNVDAIRGLKEKDVQQKLESLRAVPQKETSDRNEEGRSKRNAVNTTPIQPSFTGPDILLFLGRHRNRLAATQFVG